MNKAMFCMTNVGRLVLKAPQFPHDGSLQSSTTIKVDQTQANRDIEKERQRMRFNIKKSGLKDMCVKSAKDGVMCKV